MISEKQEEADFPLLFFVRQTTHPKLRIQTTHPLTPYFSTLFQFARLHFALQTTQHAPLPNFAIQVKIWKKQQEAAGSNTRLPTSLMPTIEKRENAAGGDYTAASNISQTIYLSRLHTAEQQEQTTLNVPLQQQERGTAAGNRLL